LWRTGEAAFRVVEYDEPVAVMTNYDYCLFDARYAAVLRQLGEPVALRPVTVSDGVRHVVWDHYLEVVIPRAVDADTIWAPPAQGLELYRFGDESLFVSEALKVALEQVSPQALHFSEGLSQFAA